MNKVQQLFHAHNVRGTVGRRRKQPFATFLGLFAFLWLTGCINKTDLDIVDCDWAKSEDFEKIAEFTRRTNLEVPEVGAPTINLHGYRSLGGGADMIRFKGTQEFIETLLSANDLPKDTTDEENLGYHSFLREKDPAPWWDVTEIATVDHHYINTYLIENGDAYEGVWGRNKEGRYVLYLIYIVM